MAHLNVIDDDVGFVFFIFDINGALAQIQNEF